MNEAACGDRRFAFQEPAPTECKCGNQASGIIVGHKENSRDPSTKSHAGGTPASESVSDYYPHLPPGSGGVRSVLQNVSRPATPRAHPAVPGPLFHRSQARCYQRRPTALGVAILFPQDTQAPVDG